MATNILLLEDDQQLSDTVKQFLTYQGYEVYCAYDGLQAQDLAYEKHIDIMLLDVKVPHQNGFDFLQNLRDNDVQTPAIFITSLGANLKTLNPSISLAKRLSNHINMSN
ncbi:MAG: response regulator [Sulfurovum sp.]|nr:response regulator [Sulfurovum sp.]